MNRIQKINEGDSGSVAATKIYQNDKALHDSVKAIQDELDCYGDLINIQVSGRTHDIVQGPGDGPTSKIDVMSQSAVTYYVEESIADACMIGPEIKNAIKMPDSAEYINAWVARASANAQGNSLTEMYNDIQRLKGIYNTLADIQAQIDSLNGRVTRLEEIIENN